MSKAEVKVAVTYNADVEQRAGKNYMVIRRTVTTTPKTGRGAEWSKQEREWQVQVLPLAEVAELTEAMTAAMFYAIPGWGGEDMDIDQGDAPTVILWDTIDPEDDDLRFWSYYEAMAYVHEARRNGKHTKGWTIGRRNVDGTKHISDYVGA